MGSRQNKRAGFGALRGAINSKITISPIPPLFPVYKDIWINEYDCKMYFYTVNGTWAQVVFS
jgi:hypothetical protein